MNNTQQTPFVPKWKFPEAQALGEACLGNLTENMTDPDALEAKRDARDLANAVPAQAKPAAPAVAGTPNP